MKDLFSSTESLNGMLKDTEKAVDHNQMETPALQNTPVMNDPDLPWEVTGESLLNNPVTEIKWLIEGLFQRVGMAALAGSSDTGKSMLLRQLAIAIALGLDKFLGFLINAIHNSAIYVSTEDGIEATNFLLNKQAAGAAPEKLNNLRFIMDSEDLYQRLDKSLSKRPADVVIIDCFSDAYGNDLKDTSKIRQWMNQLQKLSVNHNCLILFLHHAVKKSENERPSKNNLLSGQGFEAKVRLVIELRLDLINPNVRHLCIVKGNYLPASSKNESYVLTYDEKRFCFENTGDRIAFEELMVNPNDDSRKQKYLEAVTLQDAGMKLEDIAKKLGYSNKGGVSKLLKTGKDKKWS
jgi:RecA-family ATPase